ncbi:hypothetical protein N7481_007390 [Penicillium waksmanii]|uniref:uncharacterized protein n=1 Tax=Penicillium waksmanii TaxID=69791 RepID=UPI002549182E|nr:uncharacterized protein N7481_007390 [Penicillium waksmanii]KAJ5980092.1 hypothetical protein N7481_007390 [Penicillium waksmanii]
MLTLVALSVSCCLLLSSILYICRWDNPQAQSAGYVDSTNGRISDPELCRLLIGNKLTQCRRQNQLSPLESKAIPNQRLRAPFAIENVFTSLDSSVADAFVRESRNRINLNPGEWSTIGHVLKDAARKWIFVGFNEDGPEEGLIQSAHHRTPFSVRINVTSLVQALTLKAALITVCKTEARHCSNDSAILQLAQHINQGWIQSEKGTGASGDCSRVLNFEQNHSLQASLQSLFSYPDQGEANSLNLLVPSFETMWRVVLRALLEINFRSRRESPEWTEAIIAFYRNPSKEQFERRPSLRVGSKTNAMAIVEHDGKSDPTETPSARDIVMEALRLHPPTRRIYRAYQWDKSSKSNEPGPNSGSRTINQELSGQEGLHLGETVANSYQTIAADVEACHIRPDIWGSDATIFDPTRWVNLTKEQSKAFMPFGSGPHECPAKAVFGPRMICILLGALLVGMKDDERAPNIKWAFKCPDDEFLKSVTSGKRLSLERGAFDDLDLCGSWS